MTSGVLITFEGGEGAGKSTLIAKLSQELTHRGYHVLVTREPGGTPLGEHIRQWLLDPQFKMEVGQQAELMLFLAARAQHLEEVIRPALKQAKVILCDRFNDSTIVYQGIARGLGRDYVESLCDLLCKEVVPDLTFFLDLDAETGLARRKGASSLDKMEKEKLEFHKLVRQGFHQLAQEHPSRIRTLNARLSIEEVYQAALEVVLFLLTGVPYAKS